MKKLIVALSIGALMMGTNVMADSENRAVVLDFDGDVGTALCRLSIPLLNVLDLEGEMSMVLTKSGNYKVTCDMEMPEETVLKKAVVIKDIPCAWVSRTNGWVSATSSKAVASPGGNIKVQCHFNPNQVD